MWDFDWPRFYRENASWVQLLALLLATMGMLEYLEEVARWRAGTASRTDKVAAVLLSLLLVFWVGEMLVREAFIWLR